jgi:pimeloyl-ACP methyl ester carboxylesterase
MRSSRLSLRGLALPLLAGFLFSGCAIPGSLTEPNEEKREEIAHKRSLDVEADCIAVEYDHRAKEATRVRDENFDRVRFRYTLSQDVARMLAPSKPTHVFVLAHGWMNNALSAQEFTSTWIHGLRESTPSGEGVRAAFVGVHWDSERLLFHESAATALELGQRRVAQLLGSLRGALPDTRLIVVGHSLGGRLMIAAAHYSQQRFTDLALLLEAAADHDWLHGKMSRTDRGAALVVNVHSLNDKVLGVAYKNAMRSAALGRIGAEVSPGKRFTTIPLREEPDADAFLAALAKPTSSRSEGKGKVLNVDGTALIPGHTDIFHTAVFDLAWQAVAAARPSESGK